MHCGEQLAPVADRGHADADQVVGRHLRQHFAIDIVVAESRRILFEPQPCSHAATSMRCSSAQRSGDLSSTRIFLCQSTYQR